MTKWEPPFLKIKGGFKTTRLPDNFINNLNSNQGVNIMEDKSPKTFLDSLLDSTSQLFSSSYFDLARAAGIQRNFRSFGDGKILDGTDQDDTIFIEKDLTGGSPINYPKSSYNDTQINFQEGNDSLTVGGKIAVKNNQHISIQSDGGSLSVTAGGIEGKNLTFDGKNDGTSISFFHQSEEDINPEGVENKFQIKGDITSNAASKPNDTYHAGQFLNLYIEDDAVNSHNIVTIDGNIKSDGTGNEFHIAGYNNDISIGKNIIETNSAETRFNMGGMNSVFNIGGNIALSHEAELTISFDDFDFDKAENDNSTVTFHAGDVRVTDGSNFEWYSYTDISNATFGTLIAEDNYSRLTIGLAAEGSRDTIAGDVLVNGNIEAINYSDIMLELEAIGTLQVTGVVTTSSDGKSGDHSPTISIEEMGDNSALKFDGGFSINGGEIYVAADGENSHITVGNNISLQQIGNDDTPSLKFEFGAGNNTFTLNGNISNAGGELTIEAGYENDVVTINGNVASSLNGSNLIDCSDGDDILILNGQINAGALKIDGGEGNDTLVLTADNTDNFAANYQGWLSDLSSTGDLAKSNFETVRLNVSDLQTSNLGWFTDIINKANASGANIAIEDKDGHAITNVNTFLAQGNDTHNPINDVLDQYAPVAANAAQPKAFAEHVAAPSADAFTAPHFDNNNFLHEMEQQAQVHAAAAA